MTDKEVVISANRAQAFKHGVLTQEFIQSVMEMPGIQMLTGAEKIIIKMNVSDFEDSG